MEYDGGEVLPGLNEPWTFMGATLMEWSSGIAVFLMISLFSTSTPRAMPAMLLGWVGTTVALATVRNQFPDQERGVRNALTTACGFKPIGIPAPASIQPVWSGAPLRGLSKDSEFVKLGLDKAFPVLQRQYEEADEGLE